MNRLDWLLLVLGPLSILLTWALLPGAISEGYRPGEKAAGDRVIVELVGYAFEAPPDGRPRLLGRGPEAEIRLHQAPVALAAAWLLPPHSGRPQWKILPAQTGLTVRLLEGGSGDGTEEERIRETSFRPWRKAGKQPGAIDVGCGGGAWITPVPLRRVRVWDPQQPAAAEPEILWLAAEGTVGQARTGAGLEIASCPDGAVWWRREEPGSATDGPCGSPGGDAAGWSRAGRCWFARRAVCVDSWTQAWGAHLEPASGSPQRPRKLMRPWSAGPLGNGLGLAVGGQRPASILLGLDASALDPSCAGGPCEPPTVPLCPAGDPHPVATLGALELRDGDLLSIGRTRFLVRTGERRRLELLHLRSPRAPGYFRASAGHDVYHPNRRALWQVPACRQDEELLTLVVKPTQGTAGPGVGAAALPLADHLRQRRIAAADRDHGVPHELPAVTARQAGDRALLSLCAPWGAGGEISGAPDHRDLSVRLVPDSSRGIRLRTSAPTPGGPDVRLATEAQTIALGSAAEPGGRELLVDLDGNLLRIAPAAGKRVSRRLRLGLAAYLIVVLCLQAGPLTLARIARRRAMRSRTDGAVDVWERDTAWPADLGTPTLQQLAGIGIAVLLFLGANFQLFLAVHPELAGKPDYLQAFLQGVVVVSVVLAAAGGFALGDGLIRRDRGAQRLVRRDRGAQRLVQRAAHAALGAALAALAAAAWWWWDGAGAAAGLWLTELRDRTSAAAGAGPAAGGPLLAAAAGLGLGAAAVLALAARLAPRPRWIERVARRALRAPVLGFLLLAAGGLILGMVQRSALAFELAITAGLGWYGAVYWAFVRRGLVYGEDRLRHRAAVLSTASGLLMLLFLIAFFLIGSDLPDRVSFACVAAGATILAAALAIAVAGRFSSLQQVLALWLAASLFGIGFASLALGDMGSVAAWVPALLTGFFLWLVRPEESENRREEPKKALAQLLLAFGSGLVLLGLLDVFRRLVATVGWRVLERPRQRLALAEDISYITSGEWITQVRWLASRQDETLGGWGGGLLRPLGGDLQWVPNVNSDIAIFGLAANLGVLHAVLASLLLLGIAGCAALAADQALREARAGAEAGGERLLPALYRAVGLFLGMVCVLLIAQWLVHLATGVVLHLPITGLVFPWISHGNTTHLLYAAAVLLPMAAVTALGARGHQR